MLASQTTVLATVGSAAALIGALMLARGRVQRHARFHWRSEHVSDSGVKVVMRSACMSDMKTLFAQIYALAVLHEEDDELLTTEASIASAFAAGSFHCLLITLAATGEVIGSAIFQDSFRTWSGPSLYLQDLIVDADHRGNGLGTLVMRTLAAVALARGCDRMFWESHASNQKAYSFYATTIGAETLTGAHQLLTWKLIGADKLTALSRAALGA